MTLVFTLGLNIMYNEQKAIICFMVLDTVALLSSALNVQFLVILHGTGFKFPFCPSEKIPKNFSRMQ